MRRGRCRRGGEELSAGAEIEAEERGICEQRLHGEPAGDGNLSRRDMESESRRARRDSSERIRNHIR